MDRDSHQGPDLTKTLARTQPTGLPGDGTPNHGPLLEFRMARIGTGGAPTHTLGQTEQTLFPHRTRRTPKRASCGVRPPSALAFSRATHRKENTFIFCPGVCVRLTDYWHTTISSATTSAFCVGFEIGIGSDKDKRRVTGSLSRRRPHTRGTCQQLGVPPNPGAELGKKASSKEAQKPQSPAPRGSQVSISAFYKTAQPWAPQVPIRYGVP
jgi:hypothetical protein